MAALVLGLVTASLWYVRENILPPAPLTIQSTEPDKQIVIEYRYFLTKRRQNFRVDKTSELLDLRIAMYDRISFKRGNFRNDAITYTALNAALADAGFQAPGPGEYPDIERIVGVFDKGTRAKWGPDARRIGCRPTHLSG
ncbi:hypothetical protein EON81_07795 [bacterium]|nr:MAG: hypothetical protein EON81_07795 [bacterium]